MQDEEELDYAIKPLGNPLNPSHALCTGCNEVKPIKHFKTKSTNAQAISWGYKRAIEITSEKCERCRRPKKKIADMTIKEIHNKIVTGDIKGGAYGQMLKEDKRADGIRKKKEGVIKRWQKVREEAWSALLAHATTEYDRIRKQHNLKQKLKDTDKECPLLRSYLDTYLNTLKLTRQFFITQRKLGTRTPEKGKPWEYYMSKSQKDELTALWGKTPQEQKLHLTPPAFLNNRLTTEKEKA